MVIRRFSDKVFWLGAGLIALAAAGLMTDFFVLLVQELNRGLDRLDCLMVLVGVGSVFGIISCLGD